MQWWTARSRTSCPNLRYEWHGSWGPTGQPDRVVSKVSLNTGTKCHLGIIEFEYIIWFITICILLVCCNERYVERIWNLSTIRDKLFFFFFFWKTPWNIVHPVWIYNAYCKQNMTFVEKSYAPSRYDITLFNINLLKNFLWRQNQRKLFFHQLIMWFLYHSSVVAT